MFNFAFAAGMSYLRELNQELSKRKSIKVI